MTIARGTFEVRNKLGLHARAATKLVQLAAKFPCEITVGRAGQTANAKSVMGVLLLCGSKGTKLDIEANGDLHIDAHHTIEDTGITLGQAFREAIGDKKGIRRYGHAAPPLSSCAARVWW